MITPIKKGGLVYNNLILITLTTKKPSIKDGLGNLILIAGILLVFATGFLFFLATAFAHS